MMSTARRRFPPASIQKSITVLTCVGSRLGRFDDVHLGSSSCTEISDLEQSQRYDTWRDYINFIIALPTVVLLTGKNGDGVDRRGRKEKRSAFVVRVRVFVGFTLIPNLTDHYYMDVTTHVVFFGYI
ncbi:hypothetical protein L218DRAFT_285414 [Marasmius fiardii PR-910]|nr:hypothetical protein L218DRAFT_285414 [Marasmius fiardii PR-910]